MCVCEWDLLWEIYREEVKIHDRGRKGDKTEKEFIRFYFIELESVLQLALLGTERERESKRDEGRKGLRELP